jgi:putative tryptophan/tyrosine transport system substrate-binding protein
MKTVLLLIGLIVPNIHLADAQQPTKVPRIAYLGSASSATAIAARTEAFRQRLRELGYVERKNIIVEFRYAEEKLDRLPDLAKELVGLNVDVIVTAGGTSTRYAKEATGTIPIVMVQDNDPVGNGCVASLGRPGGNITGLATLAPEISGKRLELLREIVPKLSRIAVLGASSNPGNAQSLKETELAGRQFGLQLKYFDVRNLKDIENGFQDAEKERTDAVLLLVSSVLNSYRTQVVELATKNRVPAIYPFIDFVEAGGLMSYGVSFIDLHRRAANYVDKILKGSKPADLPVEQATKFELVINTKAAKQIGLTIPPNALARADKVIK